jgi:hypothetical protein
MPIAAALADDFAALLVAVLVAEAITLADQFGR